MHIGHKQDTKYTIRQDNINWNIRTYWNILELRGDLIETFKIITGKEQVNRETFFQMNRNVYDTRGHCFKLATSRSRLEVLS